MTFETLVQIIVFVNIGLTIELWRRAVRRPPKKKFRDWLWSGEPITPKHEPPPAPEAGIVMGVRNPKQLSSDFEDFANVINWHLVDYSPWRVQELPTFELSKLARSSPAFGGRYAVFHNQARVGEIELKPDYRYSTETPGVTIHIELNWVRLLPFETIRDFVTHVAVNTFEYQRSTFEYFEMNQKIDLALMDVLWKTQRITEVGLDEAGYGQGYGQITVELKGLASSYKAAGGGRRCATRPPRHSSRPDRQTINGRRRLRKVGGGSDGGPMLDHDAHRALGNVRRARSSSESAARGPSSCAMIADAAMIITSAAARESRRRGWAS